MGWIGWFPHSVTFTQSLRRSEFRGCRDNQEYTGLLKKRGPMQEYIYIYIYTDDEKIIGFTSRITDNVSRSLQTFAIFGAARQKSISPSRYLQS